MKRKREKNRIWTTKEKEKIVIPVIEFKKTLQQTCREYDISSGLLSRWIEKYKAEGISGLENKRKPGNPIAKYFTTKKFNSKEEELEDGKFTIAIAIPESEQKYDAYKVVYFDEEGKLVETLDAKLENGKVVFTTTHLSTYGVVGYNNVATKNPATNDMNLALILASLGLASAGAVLVSRKKLAKANR